MKAYDFSSPEALRTSLGPERGRTLPEMIELALAAADYDAITIELGGGLYPARLLVNEVVGFDLNERIREVLGMATAVAQTIESERNA